MKKLKRQYYDNNVDKIKATNKKWHKKNYEKALALVRQWWKENPDKNRQYKKRHRTTLKGNLNARMSRAIHHALGKNKNGYKWEDLVGYTCEDLKKHLENLFRDGMSWENMGEWHIDHKIPKAVFNYTKPEHIDFKKCWALDNLQPLWAKENRSKNIKLTKHFQPSLQM
ncbi:hypothetical protein KA005_13135 [bacterium]|nr:hypothetical protein [bacterium]